MNVVKVEYMPEDSKDATLMVHGRKFFRRESQTHNKRCHVESVISTPPLKPYLSARLGENMIRKWVLLMATTRFPVDERQVRNLIKASASLRHVFSTNCMSNTSKQPQNTVYGFRFKSVRILNHSLHSVRILNQEVYFFKLFF